MGRHSFSGDLPDSWAITPVGKVKSVFLDQIIYYIKIHFWDTPYKLFLLIWKHLAVQTANTIFCWNHKIINITRVAYSYKPNICLYIYVVAGFYLTRSGSIFLDIIIRKGGCIYFIITFNLYSASLWLINPLWRFQKLRQLI